MHQCLYFKKCVKTAILIQKNYLKVILPVCSTVLHTVLNKSMCLWKRTSETNFTRTFEKSARTQLLGLYSLTHRITLCTHSVLLPLQNWTHLYVRAHLCLTFVHSQLYKSAVLFAYKSYALLVGGYVESKGCSFCTHFDKFLHKKCATIVQNTALVESHLNNI